MKMFQCLVKAVSNLQCLVVKENKSKIHFHKKETKQMSRRHALLFMNRFKLLFGPETRVLRLDSYDRATLHYVANKLHWEDAQQIMTETLGNERFCKDILLHQYREVCFIDSAFHVHVHYENLGARSLDRNLMPTIKMS